MSKHYLPQDDEIVLYQTGLSNDLLGREEFGEILSKILERYQDSLVIALDGGWGTGKTYFLQKWVKFHEDQHDSNALTVYYDAFAHDYHSDPLISILDALLKRAAGNQKINVTKYKSFVMKWFRSILSISPWILTRGAEAVEAEFPEPLYEIAITAVNKVTDKILDDSKQSKEKRGRLEMINEFHDNIMALTDTNDKNFCRPLIIVIDELDRCRPDFALEVLEVIKHFFLLPYVHFVLGVNLEAIESMVRTRYGNDIDASSYLQKFITFTLPLPEILASDSETPNIIAYLYHQGKKMKISDSLLWGIECQLKILLKANQISIRDVKKILAITAILPIDAQKISPDNLMWHAMITLIIAKVISNNTFERLANSTIDNQQLRKFFGVNGNNINPNLPDGTVNESYDQKLHELYFNWEHIRTGGNVDFAKDWFSKFKDYYTIPHHPNTIMGVPSRIYQNYLNICSILKLHHS